VGRNDCVTLIIPVLDDHSARKESIFTPDTHFFVKHTFRILQMNEEIWEFVKAERSNYKSNESLHAAILDQFPGVHLPFSTLTWLLRRASWSESARSEPKKRGPERAHQLTQRIESLLEEDPTRSCRQIALELGKPESTVRSYLHDVLGREYKKTRWVPHTLSDAEKKRDAPFLSSCYKS
jgi:hypothetical protein